MLDFTNLPTSNKLYPGGSGAKRAVIYQGEQYLLKFPATSSKNKKANDLGIPIISEETFLKMVEEGRDK